MEMRTLGRTGLRVSAVGMGCEGFEGKTAGDCAALLGCAMQTGIRFFDVYTSNPAVRSHLGDALREYPRDSFALQGHLCTTWENGQYRRTRAIEEVKASFSELLSRMHLSYVDVGMIHYCDDPGDFEMICRGPILRYAQTLRESGTIRAVGLSTHNPDVALAAAESGAVEVIMFSINPAYDMLPPSSDVDILFEKDTFDRVYEGIDPKRERLYRVCANTGVALTVMKPFAGGLLLDERQSPFGRALTPEQCIRYCLDRPAVASVLGGMASEEEIRMAAAAGDGTGRGGDYSEILAGAPRRSFSGHCMYCGHCAPCTAGIDVAAVNRYLDLAEAQGFVPETVREHYSLLAHHAEECVACGACLPNCPFGTDIIGKMQRAAALFGK